MDWGVLGEIIDFGCCRFVSLLVEWYHSLGGLHSGELRGIKEAHYGTREIGGLGG